MPKVKKSLFMLSILMLVFSQCCLSTKDYYSLPAQVFVNTFNAIIEIPAGNNTKYEYSTEEKKFVVDLKNRVERVIDLLPYSANYGFIPFTLSKSDSGGDGDAFGVLVPSDSDATGTVSEIIPVAVSKFIDDGETDYKIIAVLQMKSKRIIKAANYEELTATYPELIAVITKWFLNYNLNDTIYVEG